MKDLSQKEFLLAFEKHLISNLHDLDYSSKERKAIESKKEIGNRQDILRKICPELPPFFALTENSAFIASRIYAAYFKEEFYSREMAKSLKNRTNENINYSPAPVGFARK